MKTVTRRVGMGLAALTFSGAALFGGTAAAHAADVYIGGWNNGDGTSTVYRAECSAGSCSIEIRIVAN